MNEKLKRKVEEEIKRNEKVELSTEFGESALIGQRKQDSANQEKFTIQLGSYRTLKEAQEFANGFKIKGYNPMIKQTDVTGRGAWYRVNLGVFNSLSQAKNYILKEKELFMGQDYVFGQLD